MTQGASIPRWAAAAGFLLAFGSHGCADDQGKVPAADSKSAQVTAWSVRLGSQGGFTGGGSGHFIHSGGKVQAWSQVVPGDSITMEVIGQADPESLLALERAMNDPELHAVKQQEFGNMTTFLEWTRTSEYRRWSWPERHGEPQLAPPLQRAYRAAQGAVTSARRR